MEPEHGERGALTRIVEVHSGRSDPNHADSGRAYALTPARRLGTLVVMLPAVATVYGSVGVWSVGRPMHTLGSALDAAVPMQPTWILVYLLIFFQALAPLATLSDRRALNRAAGAYLTLFALGLPFWVWFPVTVPRTPLPITDVWTYGVALCRYIDPPTNCMPSMHVALAMMAALVVRRHDRLIGTVLLVGGALITWSTVAVDQHWVADGVVAIAFTLFADRAWFALRPLPADALAPLPRGWHATWILAYVAVTLFLMSGWWFGWVPLDQLPPNAERW